MAFPPETAAAAADTVRHKGVRKRKWGKWVSEVRLPNSRKRIWLGSYNSPTKAARAFDAASFLLRGPRASLNFPDQAENIAAHCGRRADTPQQIQVAAASYAYAVLPPAQLPQQVSEPVKESEPAEEFNYIEQLRALTVFPAMDEFGYELLQQVEAAEQHDFWTENAIWSPGSNSNLWNF